MQPGRKQVFFSPGRITSAAFPVVLSLALLVPAPGHSALLDKGLNFGKDLLGKAAINYSKKYEQKLTQLLQSLRQPGPVNQPFIQGIVPGNPYNPNAVTGQNPYDPNVPYGTNDPNFANQYGGNQFGQNPAYDQGTQQSGYYGQTPGAGYPTNPNYSGYPSSDPNAYPQGQGSNNPYNPNQGYSQGQPYGQQNQGGYPTNPNYGGYPSSDPNAYPQGQGSNNPYNPNQGYSQGQPYGQQNQGGYPTNPNYGGYPSSDPNAYPQGQGSNNPYNPNQGYSQGQPYGQQNQGGYPTDPNYGGYPQTGQSGGGYGQYPNQGYPADQHYGSDPFGNPNQYGQAQGGFQPYDPNLRGSGYPSSPPYSPQRGQYPGYQYGGGGNPGQPVPPAQQGGYDPNQPQGTYPPQHPAYAEPATPQYPTTPSMPTSKPPIVQHESGLQLDVALLKKSLVNGAETFLPINDGDVLKDGRGNLKAGDKFRIMFRANSDCYVYVIAIDGSAWAQGVFPSLTSPFANPVKQGKQYVIPENTNWFSLDQFKGIETVFFVASPEKRQDIEDILASIAGRERHPNATPQEVTEAPIIPAGFHRSQQSTAPFTIGQDGSSDQGLIPTTYFTQKAGEALRITRWFRHE